MATGKGSMSRQPVSIIGSAEEPAGGTAYETARRVARRLAEAGVVVLCGGRTGIMEAACRGAAEGGGISIALMPSFKSVPNDYATIVIPTDLGALGDQIHKGPPEVSRNRVIAGGGSVVVAISGRKGTANEVGHALAFGRTVFGLCGAPDPMPAPADGCGLYVRDLDEAAVVARVLAICATAKP